MRRTKAAAMETRAKILQSALDIFSEKSFANASLTKIAANVGLTKGALYWHFRNKNDLLLRLVEEICRQREENIKNILETPASIESLKRFYMSQITQILTDGVPKKIHKLMMKRDEWPEDIQDNVTQIIMDSFNRERNTVQEYLRNGQEEGRFKKDISPGGLATLLSCIFHGLCAMQLIGLLPQELPQHIDILFDALEKELCVGNGGV